MKTHASTHQLSLRSQRRGLTIAARALIRRLGEPSTIAIIENWERHVGLKHDVTMPFEQRWAFMMGSEQHHDA